MLSFNDVFNKTKKPLDNLNKREENNSKDLT